MLNIDQKAKELYEKRIAPYAMGTSQSQKDALIEFQKQIFEIDYYGESTKDINLRHLDSLWKKIERSLDDLKIEKSVQEDLLQDIKEYAAMEMALRANKKLLDYDIKLFYFKKSCDVRLQRHLIRYLNKEAPISSEDEITKDILEEIEDDVDDIEEDKKTLFSGNRFLAALNSRDENCIKEYIAFVKLMERGHTQFAAKILKKIADRDGSI